MSLRCLLIGPNEQGEQATGEDTHVCSLLDYPPHGVEYVHYGDLLAQGKATRQPWIHRLFSRLARCGFLRPAPWLETLTSDEKFDLVHVHGFDLRLEGKIAQGPVILGTSSYGPANCADYLGWNDKRIARHHRRLKKLFKMLKVYDACNNLRSAEKVIVWSNYARGLHLARGAPPEKVVTIPPGVKAPPAAAKSPGPPEVLFVGKDFKRKGGEVLLKAWRKIPPELAQLTIVGTKEKNLPVGINHYAEVSPIILKNQFYKNSHILAFPTFAEGYGLVVLEAMAQGMAVVATNIGALPELVADGETGCLVPRGDADALAEKLLGLIQQPELCEKMGGAGRQRVIDYFSVEQRNEMLSDIYRQVVSQSSAAACCA